MDKKTGSGPTSPTKGSKGPKDPVKDQQAGGSPTKERTATELPKEVKKKEVMAAEGGEGDNGGGSKDAMAAGDLGGGGGSEAKGGEDDGAGWGGWLSNTLTNVQAKSTEMFQYLKQDLSEFGESVQEAGRDLKEKLKLEDTAMSAVNTVGEKMNTILEQVSSIFGVPPEDDEETTMIVTRSGPLVISRIQARIHSIAMNEEIFLKDPDVIEAYEAWLTTFDLEDKQQEMTDLLSNNPHLQLHYSQLVPDKVSHLVFWHRFYFQVYLITKEEEAMVHQHQEAIEGSKETTPAAAPGPAELDSSPASSQSKSN